MPEFTVHMQCSAYMAAEVEIEANNAGEAESIAAQLYSHSNSKLGQAFDLSRPSEEAIEGCKEANFFSELKRYSVDLDENGFDIVDVE